MNNLTLCACPLTSLLTLFLLNLIKYGTVRKVCTSANTCQASFPTSCHLGQNITWEMENGDNLGRGGFFLHLQYCFLQIGGGKESAQEYHIVRSMIISNLKVTILHQSG